MWIPILGPLCHLLSNSILVWLPGSHFLHPSLAHLTAARLPCRARSMHPACLRTTCHIGPDPTFPQQSPGGLPSHLPLPPAHLPGPDHSWVRSPQIEGPAALTTGSCMERRWGAAADGEVQARNGERRLQCQQKLGSWAEEQGQGQGLGEQLGDLFVPRSQSLQQLRAQEGK